MTGPAGRRPGDGWVECGCGRRHWGLYGAAGLLLVRRDAAGRATHVVLQHRAPWSDQGGTWGLPGGARGHALLPAFADAWPALRARLDT